MSSLGRLKSRWLKGPRAPKPLKWQFFRQSCYFFLPKSKGNSEQICVYNQWNANRSNSAKPAGFRDIVPPAPHNAVSALNWEFLKRNKITPSPSLSSELWTTFHSSSPRNFLFRLMKTEQAVRNIDAFNICSTKGTMFSRRKEAPNAIADFTAARYEGRRYCRGACSQNIANRRRKILKSCFSPCFPSPCDGITGEQGGNCLRVTSCAHLKLENCLYSCF